MIVEALKLCAEAVALQAQGKYTEAILRLEKALALRDKALGPDNIKVANSLDNLATLNSAKGDYARAELLYQRSLAIYEKVLGPEHPTVANSLNNLATIYNTRGDYLRAEPLFTRALAITEKAFGLYHPEVANSLNSLALLYFANGAHTRAEPLFKRAVVIYEKALGSEHRNVAAPLNNLAELYVVLGDYVRAEPLYQRVLAIVEKTLGPNHQNVARTLSNLAKLYTDKGDYKRAEPLYHRALTIQERNFGPEHLDVARSLNGLAELYRAKGDLERADPLFQRTLAIVEKLLGSEHPNVAILLINLGSLYEFKDDYVQAEPFYQRALAIREKAFGSVHPDVVYSLHGIARLYHIEGKPAQALAFLRRATEATESNLSRNLTVGSERQLISYLSLSAAETNYILSLHALAMPSDQEALRVVLTTLLRRKGRGLDVMTGILAALHSRADQQDQALFDQLAGVRAQLAALTLRGPVGNQIAIYRAQLQQFEEESEKLEANLVSRNPEFRAATQPISLEAVQAAIPEGSALVEFAIYRPYDPKTRQSGVPRYTAYTLSRDGESRWVELGEAPAIDRNVAALRQALRDPQRSDVRQLARALDDQVMRPVRALVGNTRRLLISPDGALNLIPFAALVDEQNHYLMERYSINYLTSGRDLLRLQIPRQSKSEPLIVADPAFGPMLDMEARPVSNTQRTANRREVREPITDFSQAYFEPLPETGREARAIKSMLPNAIALTKERATETVLKKVSAPSILHIATHGYFLQDIEINQEKTRGLSPLFNSGTISDLRSGNLAMKIENPLLRSGLALAGINQHKTDNDDGALTALEAAGLNLRGTKLVVLSACDTGVGEVKNGEGVYGLRRALVLAGSETQVMSLWPVSDYVTRQWMTSYYTGLIEGQGRSEALRQVQLNMLKRKEHRHPFYWASFIQSGEWANLNGKR